MASEWDGKRGYGSWNGRWISLQEAKRLTAGKEEWWKSEGIGRRSVQLKQHYPTGPQDKPIWLYEHGNMYLGEWKAEGTEGCPVQHGFGVTYWNSLDSYKGNVYVGNYKDGLPHGQGKEFWLESAPTWVKNKFPDSVIKQKVNGKSAGRPYSYEGEFVDGDYHDECATVTLKDGTCRVGPWKDGEPVGDWWNDDDHPLAATSLISAADSQESTETRPAKRAKSVSSLLRAKPESAVQKADTKLAASVGNLSNEANGADAASKRMVDEDSTNTTQDTAGKRVQKIKAWLMETIGGDPLPEEMEDYAKKFFEHGLHSVELIATECTVEYLDGLEWLKPFHKLLIKRKLQEDK